MQRGALPQISHMPVDCKTNSPAGERIKYVSNTSV